MGRKARSKEPGEVKLPDIDNVLALIDLNSERYINDLKEFISIYSYEINTSNLKHEALAVKKATDILKGVGAQVDLCYAEQQDENEEKGTGIILAQLSTEESKPCILVYCQFDDSGQNSVFDSSSKYVRGKSVMDSASFLSWIDVILAYRDAGALLPYNIKFILDPSSRSNVSQLIHVLCSKRSNFLNNIDICLTCCNQRITSKTPNIVYGLRGVADFYIKIKKESPNWFVDDQCDALMDMLFMLESLVDMDGNPLIDGISNQINDVTDDMKTYLGTIDFEVEQLNDWFGVQSNYDKVDHLKKLWCEPCVNIKGIKSLDKENIELMSGFTLLTVPSQTPAEVRQSVFHYLTEKWKQRDSLNNIEIGMSFWGWPWRADQLDPKYKALKEALYNVYKQKPQLVLSAAYLPFPAIYRKLTEKNVLLFTLGSFYDCQFTKHEKLATKDFINTIKVIARFINWTDPTDIPPPVQKKTKSRK